MDDQRPAGKRRLIVPRFSLKMILLLTVMVAFLAIWWQARAMYKRHMHEMHAEESPLQEELSDLETKRKWWIQHDPNAKEVKEIDRQIKQTKDKIEAIP